MQRLFIALATPPAVQDVAERTISRLRGGGDVRWVSRHHLHLTLKFLGDTPPEKLPDVKECLTQIANTFSKVVVECRGAAGAFPNPRWPQTLWLGVEPEEPLMRMAEELDQRLSVVGFQREQRTFKPHLTVGRVRSSRGLSELVARLRAEGGPGESVAWPVEELHLIQSVLTPAGPEYTLLGHYPLRPEE